MYNICLFYLLKVNELQSEQEQYQDTEQQLENQIEQLNSLLQQQMNQTTADVTSQSFVVEDIGTLQLEITELHNEIVRFYSIFKKFCYYKYSISVQELM